MASIPVANPPGKLVRPRLYKRKKKFFRGPKSSLTPHLRLANPKRKRKTRVRPTAKKRIVRRKRAHRVSKLNRIKRRRIHTRRKTRHHRRTGGKKLFNPFGSELMMVGNPHRKIGGRKMKRHRRRHHRKSHTLMNPFSGKGFLSTPKQMFSKEFAVEAVSTAAGFMAPNILMPYLPAVLRSSKPVFYLSKVGVVAALSAVTSTVSKKAGRFVLIGGGVALLLDLWAEWQNRNVAPAPTPGTKQYYGPDGVGQYYGENRGMGDSSVFLADQPEGSY